MNDNLNTIQERSNKILAEAERWKKGGGFKHRKPCTDWKKYKYCNHYTKARYRHFKPEIDLLLKDMGFQ